MPTLANPRQYFGYAKQPYESYFQERQQPVAPVNYDPLGMIGDQERQIAAQEKVFSVLGRLDAIDQAKQDRDFAVQNAGQMRMLREAQARDKMMQQQAEIGAWQRRQQALKDFSTIDPSAPDAPAKIAAYANQSPEHFQAAQEFTQFNRGLYGEQFAGREEAQRTREAEDYLSGLPSGIKEKVAAKGFKSLKPAAAYATQLEQDEDIRAEAAQYGVTDFKPFENKEGFVDPVKLNAKLGEIKRTMTPEKARAEIEDVGSKLDRALAARSAAEEDEDTERITFLDDQIGILQERHNSLREVAGIKGKTKGPPDDTARASGQASSVADKIAKLRAKAGLK